jgi:hypothetical protein
MYAGYRLRMEFAEAQTAVEEHAHHWLVAAGGAGSYTPAGAEPITFWSGFVMTSVPRCLALAVHVDGEPAPRRARIALGRRCQR